MGHNHSHNHSHSHSHSHGDLSGKSLYWAVFINILLTVAQVVGGLLSGSLSLLADALHNFSDAGALIIAAVAAKISRLPANQKMTYGYRRAEILGALINSVTLVIIGFYLMYEAITRYFDQNPIDGPTVIWVASIALVIDIMTAFLTYKGSKDSINIKAAFIHNVSDAAASVVVIVSGILITYYQLYVVDLLATMLISAYVLTHAFALIKQSIYILMQSTPEHIEVQEVKAKIETIEFIIEAHHIHIWQLDDKRLFLESHIVIDKNDLNSIETIKSSVRALLKEHYHIAHTTLEIEISPSCNNA